MFFAVIAADRPDAHELRARTKARHAKHLDEGAPGLRVLQSGPLLSDDGREHGSLLVIEAPDAATVAAFLARDPYVEAGLFATSAIHPWAWRRGNPFLATVEGRP